MFSNKTLYQRKKEIAREEREWQSEKELAERQYKLKEDKMQYKTKIPKPSTSKILIMFLFVNCSIVEIFTGWATIQMLKNSLTTTLIDFTPLVALIGAVVGEVFGYAIYSLKATKENQQGGIIYDLAMKQNNDTPVG